MYYKYIIFKGITLVRLIIIVLLGNFLGLNLAYASLIMPLVSISLMLIALLIVIRLKYKTKRLSKQSKWVSYISFFCIFFLSYTLTVSHHQKDSNNHYSRIDKGKVDKLYQIQLLEPISLKTKTIKVLAKVNQLIMEDSIIKTTGKLILYMERDSLAEQLKYGDNLILHSKPEIVTSKLNPFEFDYKRYLSYHNIYHTCYVPKENWIKASQVNSNFFIHSIYHLRNHLEFVIQTYIQGEKEQAIANAILIGKKDLLDQETIKAYSSSGAMHVLAVSGLHVGIVYIVISYLLFFLNNTRIKKFKSLIIIIIIWFYAFLTGGSPSVLRAATMFSFIALGKSLEQYINIYNMIAASALVLILINPFITTEVGFQLSYLAVLGIIFLQKKIFNLYIPKYWISEQIWTLSSVSIAAQLATFPLGILYFHQFPNFFLVSNLIVIPAAILIVYLGVSLMLLSFIPFLAKQIGLILSLSIKFLNYCIYFIDQLPYSLSSEIHISLIECYLIYFIIITASIAIIYRKKIFLKMALTFFLLLIVSYYSNAIFLENQIEFTVYHTPKNSAIEFRNGANIYSFFDKKLIDNESQMLFRIKHNWWAKKYKTQAFIATKAGMQLISFEGKDFLILDSVFSYPNHSIEVDYLVIKNQRKLNLKEFYSKFIAEIYIFDSSNSPYSILFWKKDCDELNLNCYFLGDSKAYIKKW